MSNNNDFEVLSENGLEGFDLRRSRAREASVASASALWADLRGGKVPSYLLQEALAPRTPAIVRAIAANYPGIIRMAESMTTSDFPNLTGDVLDRMLLGKFREFPSPWRRFMKVTNTLRDFRSVDRFAVDGLEGPWAAVAEGAEFEYGSLAETAYTYAPKKYARGAKLSFEALMNDDLGAFEDIPDRLGRGGARTIARFATGLYVDSSGPHASLYTATNTVTGNPVLSITSLGAAWNLLMGQVDADGEPIMLESLILVVPPALELTARNIVNATQINMTNTGGISGQEMVVNNWMGSRFSVEVDPYIPIIATSNGNTSWFLFGSPGMGRPALEVGFIRGFEQPQLFQKAANTARLGGGIDPTVGDWATMATEYKAVVGFGGTRLSPLSTVASEGDGN